MNSAKVVVLFFGILGCSSLPVRVKRQTAVVINVEGESSTLGTAAADDSHNLSVLVDSTATSLSGLVGLDNTGNSGISNEAAVLQVTNDNGEGQLGGFQAVGAYENADASDAVGLVAMGDDIEINSASLAELQGAGSSLSAGTISVLINSPAVNLGLTNVF